MRPDEPLNTQTEGPFDMSKIASITAAAVFTACVAAPAMAGEFMTCVSKTDRGTYTATKNGNRIMLKGTKKSWSANLTITERRDNTYATKVNKNGIWTNVSFADGSVAYYEEEAEVVVDDCTKGNREYTNHPKTVPAKQTYTVLDGIKAKCAGDWPGNYSMQKWCIDNQVEAYHALQNY